MYLHFTALTYTEFPVKLESPLYRTSVLDNRSELDRSVRARYAYFLEVVERCKSLISELLN